MTIDDKIKDEILQYDINREAARISALPSGKIKKYEHLTGEEILPSDQSRIIEQANFTYSPLGKEFKKQTKTTEEQKQMLLQKNNTAIKLFNDFENGIYLFRKKNLVK